MGRNRRKVVDLFCGGGGTTTGLMAACDTLGLGVDLIAVNHWPVAIATHSKNHRQAQHLCTSIDSIDPRKLVPGGKLDLLVASPECTHHSVARGGKPINDQSRASAWCVVKWASQLRIQDLLVENVKEFQTWGPLGTNGRPLKRRKGETYQAFLTALRSLGYTVEARVLNAADYGDATSRERLFIRARLGRKPIVWPEPTHAKPVKATKNLKLFDTATSRKPHRPARDIIDWSIPSQSIFERKKPLKPNTINRILKGLEKFAGSPFVVHQMAPGANRSVDDPLPTVMSRSGHGLCEPFIVELRNNQDARSLDDPLSTIATSGAHHGLCQPFIIGAGGPTGTGRPRSVDEPLKSILTESHQALIQPFLVQMGHSKSDLPARSLDRPMPVITGADAMGLVEPFVIPVNHGKDERSHDINRPMPTITTMDAWGLVEAFLVKYNGTGGAMDVDDPLDTVTAKDRFGLVQAKVGKGQLALLDIRFRMLQPHELAAAMSFPKNYVFTGNREDKVKQIGNAVAVKVATALCRSVFGG